MKLRNLLFGTMIALAFTACSDDNDPIVDPTPDPVAEVGTLSLKMGAITKAGDATINDLTAVIINADDEIEVIESSSTLEVKDITVPVGVKKVIMLANVTLGADVKTLADLKEVISINDEFTTADNFSMNSKLYTGITIFAEQHHYLGYVQGTDGGVYYDAGDTFKEVKMYRNVAKVTLRSIKLHDDGVFVKVTNDEGVVEATYPLTNPSFTIDTIAIVQTPAKSYLVGADYAQWGSTFVAEDPTYVTGYASVPYESLVEGKSFLKATATQLDGQYVKTFDGGLKIADYKEIDPFYVYENLNTEAGSQILTLLTIKGTISGKLKIDGQEEQDFSLPNRYYTVAVGVDGTLNYNSLAKADYPAERGIVLSAATKGVMRNLNYVVDASLKGIGSTSPYGPPTGGDKGDLDVKVKVVTWGEVYQSVDVE